MTSTIRKLVGLEDRRIASAGFEVQSSKPLRIGGGTRLWSWSAWAKRKGRNLEGPPDMPFENMQGFSGSSCQPASFPSWALNSPGGSLGNGEGFPGSPCQPAWYGDEIERNLEGPPDTLSKNREGFRGLLYQPASYSEEIERNLEGPLDKPFENREGFHGFLPQPASYNDEIERNLEGPPDTPFKNREGFSALLSLPASYSDKIERNLEGPPDTPSKNREGFPALLSPPVSYSNKMECNLVVLPNSPFVSGEEYCGSFKFPPHGDNLRIERNLGGPPDEPSENREGFSSFRHQPESYSPRSPLSTYFHLLPGWSPEEIRQERELEEQELQRQLDYLHELEELEKLDPALDPELDPRMVPQLESELSVELIRTRWRVHLMERNREQVEYEKPWLDTRDKSKELEHARQEPLE